jgi:hypothetical protein
VTVRASLTVSWIHGGRQVFQSFPLEIPEGAYLQRLTFDVDPGGRILNIPFFLEEYGEDTPDDYEDEE